MDSFVEVGLCSVDFGMLVAVVGCEPHPLDP